MLNIMGPHLIIKKNQPFPAVFSPTETNKLQLLTALSKHDYKPDSDSLVSFYQKVTELKFYMNSKS